MSDFGTQDLAEFAARVAELRATLGPPAHPGEYVAYTDGACLGNPSGNGGWAAVVFGGGQRTWRLFGHLSSTSNNRAEALGVLAALEWVPTASTLTVYADSNLTVQQLRGAYKIKKNADIWYRITQARAEKQITVKAEWVRGHAGDPYNELADRLANMGARNATADEPIAVAEQPSTELDGLVPRGDWEREFLTSVRKQVQRGRALSPRQQAVIDRIRARTGA